MQTFGDKTSRERPFAEFTLERSEGLKGKLREGLRVTLLEWCPGCHPERSEGSLRSSSQTLRFTQGDRHYLQMSVSDVQGLACLVHLCYNKNDWPFFIVNANVIYVNKEAVLRSGDHAKNEYGS